MHLPAAVGAGIASALDGKSKASKAFIRSVSTAVSRYGKKRERKGRRVA